MGALAQRIAASPAEAVRAAKQAVNSTGTLAEGLATEVQLFVEVAQSDAARRQMRAFLAMCGQTPDGEKQIGDRNERLVLEPAAHE